MDNEKDNIIKLIKITVVIAIIIIVGGLIYNIFIKDDGSKLSNKYIILGNYIILQKTNTSFKQIKEINDDILKLKYIVTDGEKTFKNASLQYLNNRWYAFDKNYNEINMSNFKVATHNYHVKLADYQAEIVINPLDDENINNFLDDNHISNKNTYRATVTYYDFDKDGNDELVYTLSNYSLEQTNYKQKGFIFSVKDNKIIDINDNNGNGPYTVMEILDLNNDDNYEMIINKGDIDIKTFDSCYQLYNFKNNKWGLIKDCK